MSFSATYPYPVRGEEFDNNGDVSALESSSSTSENAITDADVDVVDVGSDKADTAQQAGLDGDEYFEYYYVYYDEEGNLLSNTTAKPNQSGAASNALAAVAAPDQKQSNKVQEIKISPPAAAAGAASSPQTGDTPTIYAQIKDPAKLQENDEDEDKDEGLSIFGIPIPKIPISLSFGLAPALASGLLPLPIGRKGDSLDAEDDVVASSSHHHQLQQQHHRPSSASAPSTSITRGPDVLDPIWVETGLKAASDIIIPQLKKAFAGGGEAEEKKGGQTVKEKSGSVSRYGHRKPQMYSYQHPQNPVIPLQSDGADSNQDGDTHHHHQQVKRKGEYFPQGYLPAIKFDHPLPGRPGPLPGGAPVLPPPPSASIAAQPSNRYNTYVHHQQHNHHNRDPNHGLGSPRDHINGFRPLFRPHNMDPNYNRNNNNNKNNNKFRPPPPTSAFPGLDATLTLPAGFRSPAQIGPEVSRYPPIKAPSIQFTSPSNNVLPEVTTSSSNSDATLGPAFAAVPSSSSIGGGGGNRDSLSSSAIARPEVALLSPAPSSSVAASAGTGTENGLVGGGTTTTDVADRDAYYYDDNGEIQDHEYDGTQVRT